MVGAVAMGLMQGWIGQEHQPCAAAHPLSDKMQLHSLATKGIEHGMPVVTMQGWGAISI